MLQHHGTLSCFNFRDLLCKWIQLSWNLKVCLFWVNPQEFGWNTLASVHHSAAYPCAYQNSFKNKWTYYLTSREVWRSWSQSGSFRGPFPSIFLCCHPWPSPACFSWSLDGCRRTEYSVQIQKRPLQKPESFLEAPEETYTYIWPELGHSAFKGWLTRGWGHMFAWDPSEFLQGRIGTRTRSGPCQH